MKHYSLTVELFNRNGRLVDEQNIEFIARDCKYHGAVTKSATPNKAIIFSTFKTLVETCVETVAEGGCDYWQIRGVESDTTSGRMRYVEFWDTDTGEIYTDANGDAVECTAKYDEFFDGWLF